MDRGRLLIEKMRRLASVKLASLRDGGLEGEAHRELQEAHGGSVLFRERALDGTAGEAGAARTAVDATGWTTVVDVIEEVEGLDDGLHL